MNEQETSAAVQSTIYRYAHLGDRGDAEGLAELFHADGVLEATHGVRAVGRESIQAYLDQLAHARGVDRPAFVRHHVSTIDIVKSDHERVESQSYFLVITDRGVDHTGRYRDVLSAGSDGFWRFEHRSVRLDAPPLSDIFTLTFP